MSFDKRRSVQGVFSRCGVDVSSDLLLEEGMECLVQESVCAVRSGSINMGSHTNEPYQIELFLRCSECVSLCQDTSIFIIVFVPVPMALSAEILDSQTHQLAQAMRSEHLVQLVCTFIIFRLVVLSKPRNCHCPPDFQTALTDCHLLYLGVGIFSLVRRRRNLFCVEEIALYDGAFDSLKVHGLHHSSVSGIWFESHSRNEVVMGCTYWLISAERISLIRFETAQNVYFKSACDMRPCRLFSVLQTAASEYVTLAGNPVKEILLKLNLPDHRILKDGGEVKEFQRSFRHSDTERLSRSDEVLKLKNFKKDATLKLFKSTNQEKYEHNTSFLLLSITTPLIRFNGKIVWLKGQIQLLVIIRDEEHSASALMNFVVVRSPSLYNGIIGRPGVKKLQAVPSTVHGMLKIPVDGGVITLKSSRLVPLECAMVSRPERTLPANETKVEERIKVAINPEYLEQTIMIESTLTEEGRKKLCSLLQRNLDVFAWKPTDMTGIPRYIAEHRLNVWKGCSPVRQKKRGQAADRNQAIQEEVGKLVEAGIMREVRYHDWLSNPVMVRKHNNSWRMCVDFKDLNKACPKDGYPLPKIDWKVESLCGFPFKCFLNAYKGYHQIQIAKEDEEKTAFITNQGIFCYTKMPFGLRNAEATYQRLVDKAFHKQIGRNLEVYVDDLVIKSRTEDEIVRDMEETFQTLREINMKLNPKKCTFRIEEGMFFGYKVSTRGLKVCLDKVKAVLSLPKIITILQNFEKMHEENVFYWTTEAEEAFKQMKKLISELPMLVAPIENEELIVYLAAAKETQSVKGSGSNYTSMEKSVLALVHASKRLKRYFQAHPIIVIKDQPIQQLLSRPKVAGRLQKWSIKLGEYAIHYRPRVSVKGQIFTDFIVKRQEEESLDTLMGEEEEIPELYILFIDGSSCIDSSRAGLILTNPEGMEFTYASRFRFDATNNEAKYEALINRLKIVEQMGVKNLQANVDSRLVANQVPKSENKKADALSKIASTSFAHLSKQVLVEELKEKSISTVEVLAVVEEEGDTWMTPIFKYLMDGTLPTEVKKREQ
ncbi:reverse transcriptase domain-containing protein [Tanacetum coccineum]